jgi:PPM family protein phosphatase
MLISRNHAVIVIGNAQTVGRRENQQDYFASLAIGDITIALVADGMGGYEGGEQASEQVLKMFMQHLRSSPLQDIPGSLRVALGSANKHLARLKKADSRLKDMGTTFLAVITKGDQLWWLSVGDSPLYRIHQKQMERLNVRHNYGKILEEAVLTGELSPEEARVDPNFNSLSSAVIGEKIPLIDCPVNAITLKTEDFILLTTDGIHALNDDEILELVTQANSPQTAADQLITAIDEKDDPFQDNATVLALQYNNVKK